MSFLQNVMSSAAVERLGWTLVHFVWQGAAVALVLGVALAAMRRRSAGARYVASCLAMIALAAAPVVTFVLTPVERREVAAAGIKPIPLAPANIHMREGTGTRDKTPKSRAADASFVGLETGLSNAPRNPGKSTVRGDARGATTPAVKASVESPTWRQRARRMIDSAAPAVPWMVLGWCAGVLVLSAWNLGGWAAVRRLRSRATRGVSADVVHSAARLSGLMGLRRAVRVLQSTLIDSPMVIGAIKPVILLPAGLLTGLSPAQLDSLLAHELAHVRRHDYLVNLIQGVVETLLFYHPAVWWVSRRIRIEREHCCDDAVVALVGDRAAYVTALAAVAESAAAATTARPWSTSGAVGRLVPAASGGSLLARVRRLLGLPDADAARSPRWLAGAVAMALCLLAATAVVTRGQDKPPAKDKDFDLPADKVLDLEVIDKASGEPLPALTLSVRLENGTRAFSTDGRGHARVEYAPASKYLGVTAKPDGYVPTQVAWRNYTTKEPVPDKFTLELEKGTTIGGIIHDEAGQPIPGVTVFLLIHRKGEDANNSRITTAIWDFPVKTDEDGRWHCDVAPKELDDPWIRLSHPDYLSDEMYGMTPKPPLAKLRDQTGVMVLKKGAALAGRVLDDTGKPIANAKVMQGQDRFGSHFPDTKTDAEGNFKFAQVRKGSDVVLPVTARGRAPDQKTIRVDKDTTDVEFRLEPGHIVKGRVVDPAGKPLGGVMIATDTWRGNRALMFRTNTDGDGRWTWKEAPSDEVLTDILQQGYMDLRRVSIRPSDQEQTFTLKPPLHVTGTVIDAETQKPVDRFKVIQGTDWGNRQQPVSWDRRETQAQGGGKFEFDVTYPRPGYAVRIESDGYLPAESKVFHDANGPTVSLEFKLKRGQPLAGVVRGPDGKPVAGADVMFCTGQQGAYVSNGELQQRRDHLTVQTDNAGRYRLPPQSGQYMLVAVHDRGYAEVASDQLEKSTDITLEPWGRVTGVVRAGSKVKPGVMLSINRLDEPNAQPNRPRVYHDLQAQAGPDGRFTFERVPAGKAQVAVQVKTGERSTTFTQATPVDVKAGETVEVQVGGTGRPVTGRVSVPAEVAGNVDWSAVRFSFSTKVDVRRPKLPDDWADMDDAARRKWGEAWQQGPEGRAQQAAYQAARHFAARLDGQGKFTADDVPAGTYTAMVMLMAPPKGDRPSTDVAAMVQHEFTVPPSKGAEADEPLDIGVIELKPMRQAKVGEVAPQASGKTLADDRPAKLSDYRGKYVLANFWSSLGSTSAALSTDVERLKEAHAKYGKDARLVMLGLVVDEPPATAAKRFVEKHQIAWPQILLTDFRTSAQAREWGINRTPASFLIGPDGKVLAANLDGTGVADALKAALGEPK